mgnify:CR=1 FL=1
MKYLLVATFISLTSYTFASEKSCEFSGGDAKIQFIYKNKANVILHSNKTQELHYKNCSVSSDTVGRLIDCSSGTRDFMILLSKGERSFGGVMSTTLNIFEDLSC